MAGAVFKFETSDGHTLSYESWSSANQASAGTPITVVFLHGVHESADTLVMTQAHYRDCCACLSLMDVLFTPDAEHAPPTNARDHQTARRLGAGFAARGHVFLALEQHGHGRSTGQRGLVVSFDLLVQHAAEFVKQLVGSGTERVVIAGHSLGGAVAAFLGASLRQQHGSQFLGAIFIAPCLSGPTPDWLTRTALAGLSSIWGGAPVGPPEHPEEYDTGSGLDINYRGNMQARTCKVFVDLFLQVAADFAAHGDGGDCEGGGGGAGGGEKGGVMPSLAEFPWLAVHGRKDGVVPIGKGRLQTRFYDYFLAAPTANKLSEVYAIPEGHQPFSISVPDERWQEYVNKMVAWTEAVAAASTH